MATPRFGHTLRNRLTALERSLAGASRGGCAVCRQWLALLERGEPSPWDEHDRCPTCGYDPGWPRCFVTDWWGLGDGGADVGGTPGDEDGGDKEHAG